MLPSFFPSPIRVSHNGIDKVPQWRRSKYRSTATTFSTTHKALDLQRINFEIVLYSVSIRLGGKDLVSWRVWALAALTVVKADYAYYDPSVAITE